MKGNRVLLAAISVLFCGATLAQTKIDEKIIYKWESQGLVYYSHIKPTNVQDYIKLDSSGRKIEDLSEDFDEIVEIAVRPKETEVPEDNKKAGPRVVGDDEIAAEVAAEREANIRQQNCETARKNLNTINGGEVYERDSNGNMIRMTPEQIESKRSNVQKDIDYFCGGQ